MFAYNQEHLLFTSQNLKPAHFHNGFPIAKNKTKSQLAQIVQHYLVIAQAALRSTHHFQTPQVANSLSQHVFTERTPPQHCKNYAKHALAQDLGNASQKRPL